MKVMNKIEGLNLRPLRQIKDHRGSVMHFIRKDASEFKEFGEVYFSKINGGVVKGWKLHHRISQLFCIPFGIVKIVIYDDRPNSSTRGTIAEVILDDDANYNLLSIPPKVWYSFKSLSTTYSLLANVINEIHSQDESETDTLLSSKIPYSW